MKPGQASRTAVLVAMGRALAHRRYAAARFDDPTAVALLPDDARARLARVQDGAVRGVRERFLRRLLERQAAMMVPRTVAIDDAIRAAAAPQLVILGAGLDGRAWRMAELGDAVVFEVDHPDSQRAKRARAAALALGARELRWVAVDFERDDLGAALAAAGHDPTRPTTWVWEGVIMYLEPAAIDATLAVVARRSAPGSRLVILYHEPAWILHAVGVIVRRLGDPFRSTHTADAMRALLLRHGLQVARDQGLAEIVAAMPSEVARTARVLKHLRVVTAEAGQPTGR
jgi:methyltransferase (TIGR00027 family)